MLLSRGRNAIEVETGEGYICNVVGHLDFVHPTPTSTALVVHLIHIPKIHCKNLFNTVFYFITIVLVQPDLFRFGANKAVRFFPRHARHFFEHNSSKNQVEQIVY